MPSIAILPESAVSESLDRAIRRLLCECFPADAAAFALSRAWHGCAPAWTVIAREDEQLLACAAVVERTIACGTRPVVVAGVGNLCVTPVRRGTGLARRVLERVHAEARGRGLAFGLLFCTEALEPLYAALGWSRVEAPITMLDREGLPAPLPPGNIGMYAALGEQPWPDGPVHLQGRDW